MININPSHTYYDVVSKLDLIYFTLLFLLLFLFYHNFHYLPFYDYLLEPFFIDSIQSALTFVLFTLH